MKAKTFFLTLFLSVAAVSLWAQEKYELLIVSPQISGTKWSIAVITSTSVEATELPKGVNMYSAELKKVEELIAQGWEIYNVTDYHEIFNQLVYHLRRKKN